LLTNKTQKIGRHTSLLFSLIPLDLMPSISRSPSSSPPLPWSLSVSPLVPISSAYFDSLLACSDSSSLSTDPALFTLGSLARSGSLFCTADRFRFLLNYLSSLDREYYIRLSFLLSLETPFLYCSILKHCKAKLLEAIKLVANAMIEGRCTVEDAAPHSLSAVSVSILCEFSSLLSFVRESKLLNVHLYPQFDRFMGITNTSSQRAAIKLIRAATVKAVKMEIERARENKRKERKSESESAAQDSRMERAKRNNKQKNERNTKKEPGRWGLNAFAEQHNPEAVEVARMLASAEENESETELERAIRHHRARLDAAEGEAALGNSVLAVNRSIQLVLARQAREQ
jgi:FtsZ-binding cell division protein ZapB